ncbi:hypothetical protein V5420_001618 [Listeria monocytogenes]
MNRTSSDLKKEFPELNFIIDNRLPRKLFGVINRNVVHLNPTLTEIEARCTIVEEAKHWKYTVGDITKYDSINDIKQEKFARRKAHNYLINLDDLVLCYELGITTYYEASIFLNVTEQFLLEAIENFREKYGLMYDTGKYIINFGPTIQIFKEDNSSYAYDYGA